MQSTRGFTISLIMMFCTLFSYAQRNMPEQNAEEMYVRALEYFEHQNYNLAKNTFQHYIHTAEESYTLNNHFPHEADAYFYSAVSSKYLDQDNAIDLLTEYVDRYPDHTKVMYGNFHLGQLYYKKRDYNKVISNFTKVKPGELAYDDLVDFRFQLAYSYFASKQFSKARKLFEQFKDVKDKYYDQSNYYHAYLTYLDGDYQEALEGFKRIDEINTYKRVVPYYITYIHYINKNYTEVINYGKARATDSKIKYNKEISQLVGNAFYKQTAYDQALPFLQRYVDGSSKVRKEDIYQLAYTQYKTAKYGEAIRNFEELTVLKDSLGHNALSNLADCYLKTKQKEKARNAFASASRLNVDRQIQENASFNYAKLSYELGFDSDAVKSLTGFISKYPESEYTGEARRLLSQVFEYTRNYKEAIAILEALPEMTPDLKKSYQKVTYARGIQKMREKQNGQAAVLFNKSLEYPVDGGITGLAHFWLGDLAYKAGSIEAARQSMNNFLSSGSSDLSQNATKNSANYTIGYSYLREKDYTSAQPYFNKVEKALSTVATDDKNTLDNKLFSDALLRSADCLFMAKDYSKAKKKYTKAINKDLIGADYAYYQRAIILGLEGKNDDKIEALNAVAANYTSSIYRDDALYEIAETHLAAANYQPAIKMYNKVIQTYSKSPLTKKSLLRLGLINYNLDKNDVALDYYKQVARKYPNTSESKEALAAVKDIYISLGDPRGYTRFATSLDYVNVTNAAQDSVTYLAAETRFRSGNCDLAVADFTDYLLEFPKGNFAMEAHFYRGECLYNQGDYRRSLKDYEYILDQPINIFSEKAMRKAADVTFYDEKDYEKSYLYYKKLYDNASTLDGRMEGLTGLVKSSYAIKNFKEFEEYSSKLIIDPDADETDILETRYLRGKMAYERKNYDRALNEFNELVVRSNSEMAAEAKYLISEMYYKRGDYILAKNLCFELANNYAEHDQWVVRGFILLSDVYIKTDELFQAKATLQSIIDNSGDDEAVRLAKSKLKEVEAIEKRNSKISSEGENTEYLEMDSPDGE